MTRTCRHEDAVVAAALAGDGLDAQLAAHITGCANCREVQALVSVLHDDRTDALAHAQVPSAGLVWWKATLRARHEDATRATRPITVVAAVTAAAVAGLLVSVAGLLAWWMQDALAAQPVVQALAAAISTNDPAGAVSGVRLAVWLVAGALLVATPLLLYVALRDE